MLVIGATAGTGAHVVRRLRTAAEPVRVLVRDPDRTRALPGDGLEVVRGDVTVPETVDAAVVGAGAIVYTAGVRSFFAERRHRAVAVDGVAAVVASARRRGLPGRIVLMSSIGTARPSPLGCVLNAVKGRALDHKARAEALVRESCLDYAIVRAGCLNDEPGGRRLIVLEQEDRALGFQLRICREDAAAVLVQALTAPQASCATFDAFWGRNGEPARPRFEDLVPDGA